MKRKIGLLICVILVSLCVFALADVAVDQANFPDANFREYVKTFDKNADGRLSSDEIRKVTEIDVSQRSIENLKGIEHFTALTSLTCYSNLISQLDLSRNTALTDLFCWDNQLKKLDVSKNTALRDLDCSHNRLKQLDLSKNTALRELRCYQNQLKQLDVSKNTALVYLSCSYNQLKQLDLSSNTALVNLTCSDNQINQLNVSKNTALTNLFCVNNRLKKLDISKNTALIYMGCSGNQLKQLDVSKNTALSWLSCGKNQLSKLDIRKCRILNKLVRENDPDRYEYYGYGWWKTEEGGGIEQCLFVDERVRVITDAPVVKITSIKLNKTKATLKKGKTLQLKIKQILPENATNKKVKWTSSNKKVATVDKNGKVKAKGKGKCTITCMAADGSGVKATCKINVK